MAVKWLEVYGAVVSSTYMSMSRGVVDIKGAKEGLRRLLTETTEGGEKPWRRFIIRSGDGSILEDTTNNPLKDFREFVEAQPLRGLGQSVSDIERLLGDDDEALTALRRELTRPRGNPTGANQYSGNGNNIPVSTDTTPPDLFTEPAPKPPKPKTSPDRGTRKDYTLSRLKQNEPELFEAVKAGELSANAAAIKAGIRRPYRSIPVDSPESAIKALTRVFSLDQIIQAAGRLADGMEDDQAA